MKPAFSEDSLPTRASLLARLKDWNSHESWQSFFDAYWQLLYRVCIRSGLTESEAQDTVQETLLAVARNIRSFEYDSTRCSFKSWLMLITRQRIIWQLRKRFPCSWINASTETDTARTSTVERLADPSPLDLDELWEREWHVNLLCVALEQVKHKVSPSSLSDLAPSRFFQKSLKIGWAAEVY